MKTILKLIIVVIVLIGGLFAASKFGFINFDFLKRKPLSIENTTNVVEDIKKIGEFTTAYYYEEMALKDSYKTTSSILGIKSVSTNEIVLIGKGRVRAGFDLSQVQPEDINVHGDTIEMTIAPAKIFDIILNPSDFSTEYESGTWSHERTKPIKAKARDKLTKNAIDYGILKKAEESGLRRLENLLQIFGFKTVILKINNPETAPAEDNNSLNKK